MAQKYFSGLNYTLGNEDTTLEIELMKRMKPKKIFSVCGSGGRALPLVDEDVTDLTLSDLSREQILLAKLREATYKEFIHEDFLCFWGYYPYSDDNFCEQRKRLFYELKLHQEVKTFFEPIFTELSWCSVLYLGKWERTFALMAKINRALLGSDYDHILRFDDLSAQRKYYKNEFPHQRWKLVLHLLGNKAMFNALLYKGDFIEKNSDLTHFEYYHRAFENLFTQGLAQKSFFLQLCFYGKIKSLLGVPVEASLESLNRIKSSQTHIHYVNEDLVTHLKKGEMKYDFLSLSDVPSYFKGELERNFMQDIKASLNPGALVVNRYYLRVSQCNLDGFLDVTKDHQDLITSELVQMYDIRLYKYQG